MGLYDDCEQGFHTGRTFWLCNPVGLGRLRGGVVNLRRPTRLPSSQGCRLALQVVDDKLRLLQM